MSKKVKGFGKWVGFPIDSYERRCVEFFQRLEKVWEKQAAVGSLRRTASSSTKGMRELRNLISTVNYDGQVGKRTKEIVKFSGLGSDGGLRWLSMNLRLLSWNVRGFNNPQKRDTVKNLLKEWKCKVVCF